MSINIQRFEQRMIGHHIGLAGHTLRNTFIQYFKGKGIDLTPEQFLIVKMLYGKDGVVQNVIANHFLRDDASITRALDSLEKKNFIERRKSKSDRRANLVFISDKGRAFVESLIPIAEELNQQYLKGVPEDEIEALKKTIKKIVTNAKAITHLENDEKEINHKNHQS